MDKLKFNTMCIAAETVSYRFHKLMKLEHLIQAQITLLSVHT